MPRHPPRRPRGDGRLPGDVPGPDQEGPFALGPRFARPLAAPGRLPGRGTGQGRCGSSARVERRLAEATLGQAVGRDRHDLAAAVHEELDRLPERYRVPIVLCDLEGRTCEEAARHLGCPIGTIGSRLARGRERLRDRLARRGLVPAVGTLVAMLSTDSEGAGMPATLTKSTIRLGLGKAAGDIGAGAFSAASAKLAENISRSLLMAKFLSVGAASVAAVGVGLTAAWTLRPGVGAQVPPAPGQVAPKANPVPEGGVLGGDLDEFPFMNDKERMKDYLSAEIGNMRPLIKTTRGVAFQSREAIRYKDGTAKLCERTTERPRRSDLAPQGTDPGTHVLRRIESPGHALGRVGQGLGRPHGRASEGAGASDDQPDVALVRPQRPTIRDDRFRTQGRDRLGCGQPNRRRHASRRVAIMWSSRLACPGMA